MEAFWVRTGHQDEASIVSLVAFFGIGRGTHGDTLPCCPVSPPIPSQNAARRPSGAGTFVIRLSSLWSYEKNLERMN